MSAARFNNSSTLSCVNGTCYNLKHNGFAEEPKQLATFRFVVIGLVLFASLVGNTVVIKAILGKRGKPFVYYLVTNLAVGELITTLCIPFVVTYTELATWIFGDFLCRLLFPLYSTSATVVTTTIAVISVRRYQVVTGFGMNFPATKRSLWLMIACIWLYALAVCSPLFIYIQESTQYTTQAVYCMEVFPTTEAWFASMFQHYHIVRVVLSYGIQVAVMILSYGAVTISIKKQVQSIIKNARPRVDSTQSNTRITDYNLDAQRSSSPQSLHQMLPLHTNPTPEENTVRPEVNVLLDQEGDLTKMFYIIVLLFILLYLPANIFHTLEITKSFSWFYHMFVIRRYLDLLSYFTLALHPLCYGTMSRFYAKAFKKLILCKC